MLRKVFKTGNSIVVALPKEMLESLRIGEGQEVSVELDVDRRQILIASATPVSTDVDAEFARQVADFIATYRPALEALAR
jgi:putative addiction module antidote